jgi:malate dehydrogenase
MYQVCLLSKASMEGAELAVIGASGDIGREIVAEVLRERLLAPTGRVQLVGRSDGRGAGKLLGLVSDLTDAHAEVAPTLEVVFDPERVTADVVVMAAGATLAGSITTRAELAQTNLPIFHRYAHALGEHGLGHEVVLVVSNPVELAVQVFSQYVDRHRVIGIGAHSDSLRFRRELASELGIRRQRVQGFVLGEHGDGQVPVWSSVRIHGVDAHRHLEILSGLRRGRSVLEFPDEVAQHKQAVWAYLQEGRVHEAFERVDRLRPDLRVVLRPYVTQISGAKTAAATGAVTLELIRTLLEGREEVVAGQVQLDGEFDDLHAPVGVPIVVSPQGWTQVVPLTLWPDELELLTRQTNQLLANLRAWSVAG